MRSWVSINICVLKQRYFSKHKCLCITSRMNRIVIGIVSMSNSSTSSVGSVASAGKCYQLHSLNYGEKTIINVVETLSSKQTINEHSIKKFMTSLYI